MGRDSIFVLNDEDERSQTPGDMRFFYDSAPEAGFTEHASSIVDHTEIQGYFQSEKYYDDPSEVRSWYTFQPGIVKNVDSRYGHLFGKGVASLSLRLDDDYLAIREYFPCSGISYYVDACRLLDVDGPVLVFSDRPDRARQFLTPLRDRELIFVSDLAPPEQMYLMTRCDANVITNSTFAWWGAWLNQTAGRKIVAPAEWNRPGIPIPIRDVLCDEWMKIRTTVPVWDHFQVWRVRHPVATAKRVVTRLWS